MFLYQNFHEDMIHRDYERQVSFAGAPTLDEVIGELQDAGVLISTGEALRLRDAPRVRSELETMAHVLEDPTGRQELLRRLYRHAGVQM